MRHKQKAKKLSANGSIRIISGQWRGRKLPVLDLPGLRPTTDRTKETLFNWLAPYVAGSRVLDGFAGSAGLGLEALSRNAAHCTFIELHPGACQQLKDNLTLLKVSKQQAEVHQLDALQYLQQCQLPQGQAPFDLIFLDPPFNQGLAEKALTLIQQRQLLQPDGLLYLETELGASHIAQTPRWQVLKQKQTKQLCYQLLQLR